MKKHFTFFILWIASTLAVSAQYNQFVNNKLAYNPGYAGSQNTASVAAVTRNQLSGFEGSPQTQILTFDTPFTNSKSGIGINAVRDAIGLLERYAVDVAYAYHLKIGKGALGIGGQVSTRWEQTAFAGIENSFSSNVGIGIYYQQNNFYAGISAPRLVPNNNRFDDLQQQRFYAMSGIMLPINSKLKLQPQVLLNFTKNVPLAADLNLNLVWLERFTTGAIYHLGRTYYASNNSESISIFLSAQLFRNWTIAASYDHAFSELERYNSGTLELAVRYNFGNLNVE